ncbi:type II toxin-antitoxin system Phd/YefM family antitoxin [Pedobacter hartonius]|uniref:Antitoxin n=1 Tax=Pedobacter hartonius TaxID=425514 RepID=A0A1H4DUW5_9SPHI|nr:type II toxin-antitoxin system prevent-host-death family antitoxin [Pedobacter hartonius]SEA76002.1 antitoxin YefM [Pedobacter hartonius]
MRNVLNMEITTYTAFRQHLKSFLDKVLASRSPLFVTRSNGEDVVVISKADYDSMQETFYLLKSPKNAARLLDAIENHQKGKGGERTLIEE